MTTDATITTCANLLVPSWAPGLPGSSYCGEPAISLGIVGERAVRRYSTP